MPKVADVILVCDCAVIKNKTANTENSPFFIVSGLVVKKKTRWETGFSMQFILYRV
jgi:hypothetical protein